MSGKKLAQAAQQQLKGVIVEYDALCSTLLGRTAAEQAEEQRRKDAQRAKLEELSSPSGGLFSRMVSNMFVSDVRSMLKDLQQDATGKPWVVKDRLQSTLQGLPTHILDRVTGDDKASPKSDEEEYLEKQLASASAEAEQLKQQRRAAGAKVDSLQQRLEALGANTSGSSSARDKYMDKINKLKAKAKTRDPSAAMEAFTSASNDSPAKPVKGLTSWIVHDGTNELMEEFELFCKEMEGQFEAFMQKDDLLKFPDPEPISSLCKSLALDPVDVLVIARHAPTIRAARAAGAHSCHYMKSENEIPNHSADYQVTSLREFQYIVEEFNGISYRGRTAANRPTAMTFHYVATAQKPTSVTHALTAAFTGPNDRNLLLAKSTRFEVHAVTPDGLVPLHDVALYGRVIVFETFRAPNEPTDWIFIVTQRFQFCVLAYDSAARQIVTKAHGHVRDAIGRCSELVTAGNIDPEGRLIGMNLYEGYFKVIPIDQTKSNHGAALKEAFNIRLDELRVIDIKFLHGYSKPTICVLYEDCKGARHVKTYVILLKEKDFAEGPWHHANVEAGASLLIPVPMPLGGVLIVSQQTIVYHNGSTYHVIPMQSTVIQVYGSVDKDGSRFLLADQYGALSVVSLQHNGKDVTNLFLEVLVLDRYVNIGPITDFCVMDLDRQGQGQIVTCSGADKDGSLRVIRNGIGINEQAVTEMPGIKGMWALRETFASEHDKYLLQSYVNEIRILAIDANDEMEEKRVSLGSQPISLSLFRSKDTTHVFAACDRPTVIYSNNNKLLFSNVNTKEVSVMCPFDPEAFPECLALASEELLTIEYGSG
ncbi:hypothetical protein ATCC90586_003567 [Pythium insidiosum]|nr:hypothetical protein ATCC90586_003567 [Pythium insidiosum]